MDVHVVVPGNGDDSDDRLGIDVLRLGMDVRDHPPNVIAYGSPFPRKLLRSFPTCWESGLTWCMDLSGAVA